MILEIRIGRGGMSIQGPVIWAIPGSLHFYSMLRCGSLPSATDGNPHTQLPRRLAHSGSVAESFNIAQHPPAQPLRLPGAQGQLCQEHTVTQPMGFVPGSSYRLSADDNNSLSGTSHDNSAPCGLLQGRYRPSAQSFPENAGPYGSGFTGTSVGSASHATHPVLDEAESSIRGLASRWRDPFWLKQGVILDMVHRRKVVMTDASNKGWEALCEGKPTFGLWSEEVSGLHINCLEMLAVCQACQFFLPDIRGHHVLIRSDSRSVVSYINHQGCLVSKLLCMLENDLLVWAQTNLRSLKVTHVLGKMNQGADMLSRNNVSSEEWMLHPLAHSNLGNLWQGSSRPLRLQIKLSLPNLFYK